MVKPSASSVSVSLTNLFQHMVLTRDGAMSIVPFILRDQMFSTSHVWISLMTHTSSAGIIA